MGPRNGPLLRDDDDDEDDDDYDDEHFRQIQYRLLPAVKTVNATWLKR